jgi:hypothetical protein
MKSSRCGDEQSFFGSAAESFQHGDKNPLSHLSRNIRTDTPIEYSKIQVIKLMISAKSPSLNNICALELN